MKIPMKVHYGLDVFLCHYPAVQGQGSLESASIFAQYLGLGGEVEKLTWRDEALASGNEKPGSVLTLGLLSSQVLPSFGEAFPRVRIPRSGRHRGKLPGTIWAGVVVQQNNPGTVFLSTSSPRSLALQGLSEEFSPPHTGGRPSRGGRRTVVCTCTRV